MANRLSQEEADALVATAQNAAAAQTVLSVLRGAGMPWPAIVAALLTAATGVIEDAYGPRDRLSVLNAMLAETIHEWAAAAQAAGVSVQ